MTLYTYCAGHSLIIKKILANLSLALACESKTSCKMTTRTHARTHHARTHASRTHARITHARTSKKKKTCKGKDHNRLICAVKMEIVRNKNDTDCKGILCMTRCLCHHLLMFRKFSSLLRSPSFIFQFDGHRSKRSSPGYFRYQYLRQIRALLLGQPFSRLCEK